MTNFKVLKHRGFEGIYFYDEWDYEYQGYVVGLNPRKFFYGVNKAELIINFEETVDNYKDFNERISIYNGI